MRFLRYHVLVLICASIWALPPSLSAQAAPAPHEVLRAMADDALSILTDRELSEQSRQHAFRGLLQRCFDIDAVSRFVLGRHWRQTSAEDRQAFKLLFEDYVVATYAVRLGQLDAKLFQVTGTRQLDRPREVLVTSEIQPPDAPRLKVDWRMHDHDGQWQITDVVIEGVSMVLAQRAEFASVIRNDGGVGGLIARLEAKTRHLSERRYAESR